MRAVGVKKLKARLSEYLRLVRAGETVLVTDRDEVIAELRPARRQRVPDDTPEAVLNRLADADRVTRPAASRVGWHWRVEPLGLPAGSAAALLEKLRGDRD